jgi:hypothetical protein
MKLPQLALRELFLLVALVAMGCGWWMEHHRATDRDNWKRKFEVLELFCAVEDWNFRWEQTPDGWEATRFSKRR